MKARGPLPRRSIPKPSRDSGFGHAGGGRVEIKSNSQPAADGPSRLGRQLFSKTFANVGAVLFLVTAAAIPQPVVAAELSAAELVGAFDRANKLYYQGFYSNAAVAYQDLLAQRCSNATVYFNQGNSWFKAGQTGRAIAAYRKAQQLDPRDPSLRFNLNFARKQVTGRDESPVPLWRRCIAHLTLDEWTLASMAALWLWFLLLGGGEVRPAWKRALRNYVILTGVFTAVLVAATSAAAYHRFAVREAVVVVPQAIARYGPLTESQVAYQLRDGSELELLDRKELTAAGGLETWLQVRASEGRAGWLRSDQVILIP